MSSYDTKSVGLGVFGVLVAIVFWFTKSKEPLQDGFLQQNVKQIVGTTASSHSFSLSRAFASFQEYSRISSNEVKVYRSRFASLRGAHRRMATELGYHHKISKLEQSHAVNALLTDEICTLAREEFPSLLEIDSKSTDVGRVRESLKHFVRDWSDEGRAERECIFTPILSELERTPVDKRSVQKVLIPGSGLGRLAWEISCLGYNTTSCELSYFMNLSLRFLLSPNTTSSLHQHQVRPYAHWWSHQKKNETTFRSISFPDVLPRRSENWTILEEDFLALSPPPGGYDVIVTLYFIDTASNIISYLSHIHHLLKPNGRWINLGPLLYSGATLELSLEEVFKLANLTGFDIIEESRQLVSSEYTADRFAMMKWMYQSEYWIAVKRSEE